MASPIEFILKTLAVKFSQSKLNLHAHRCMTLSTSNYEANYNLANAITDIRITNTSAATATTANLIFVRFEWFTDAEIFENGLKIRSMDGLTLQGRNGINPGAHELTMTQAVISKASADSSAIVAASAGNIVRIWKIFLISTAANIITFEDSDGTDLSGAMSFAANSGIVLDLEQIPITCAVGKGFNILASAADQISGMVWSTTTAV